MEKKGEVLQKKPKGISANVRSPIVTWALKGAASQNKENAQKKASGQKKAGGQKNKSGGQKKAGTRKKKANKWGKQNVWNIYVVVPLIMLQVCSLYDFLEWVSPWIMVWLWFVEDLRLKTYVIHVLL